MNRFKIGDYCTTKRRFFVYKDEDLSGVLFLAKTSFLVVDKLPSPPNVEQEYYQILTVSGNVYVLHLSLDFSFENTFETLSSSIG